MNVQIIMRDGEPEYAVIPWNDYQSLLTQTGLEKPLASAEARPFHALAGLRDARGLSQDELARAVGISPAYLAMIERGERAPDDAIRRALGRALGVGEWE